MITCTRRIQFCSGHRVYGHEGKCRNLHGHNYVAFITAEAADLDSVGRVIDFSVLKEKVGVWIDAKWDHGTILWSGDDQALAAVSGIEPCKLFVLPSNPTAENMAWYLLNVVCPVELGETGVRVTSVRLWETENCYADAVLDDPTAVVAGPCTLPSLIQSQPNSGQSSGRVARCGIVREPDFR